MRGYERLFVSTLSTCADYRPRAHTHMETTGISAQTAHERTFDRLDTTESDR